VNRELKGRPKEIFDMGSCFNEIKQIGTSFSSENNYATYTKPYSH
jgi:hypothetical protein